MEIMGLGLGAAGPGDQPPQAAKEVEESSTPPWEESTSTAFSLESVVTGAPPDVGYQPGDEEELEIFEKARHFNKLQLISGNQIPGGVTEDYIRGVFGQTGAQRFRLANFVLSNLGYRPSPDVIYMLSCTNHARVVIATAGAGKTTSLQFDLVISKMLDKATGAGLLVPELVEGTKVTLPRILYLNYNNHNVRMISDRHTSVCSAVNKLLTSKDAVDDSIESSTVHAFCHKWLTACSVDMTLPDLEIISDDMKKKIWESVIAPRWTKFYNESSSSAVEYTVLDELYTYKTESMMDWDELFVTAKFVDSGLLPEFAKSCIKKYDSMKASLKLMDFTDYLIWLIRILKENEAFRTKLQKRYRIIIADENQDFTRLMNELLIQLYNPEYNQLVVVGDPDQTIYDFKGVSPDNVVTLSEVLPDVRLIGLDTNYRCPDVIVDAAKRVLDMNMLRFKKPIQTVKTGGRIIPHACAPSAEGAGDQISQVIGVVKQHGPNAYPSTVIAYRNNSSSVIISEELYYAGIPFKIYGGRRPFTNNVFRHIFNALRALKDKDDLELNKGLYRFLPMSKDQWGQILEDNRVQRRYHFHDLVYPQDMPKGAVEALQTLARISVQMDDSPVCDYIAALTRLYRMYYFDFLIKQTTFAIDDISDYELYYGRMMKFFNRQSTFDYMAAELRERNIDNEAGVTLSTFHGLKGLEYDYVIAIDFNESVFPNYMGIEQRYSRNTCMYEKESANRLCYVLVTRAIKELHLFYSATDPSLYLRVLGTPAAQGAGVEESTLSLGAVSSFTDSDAKMSFMKRILGNRG